ncbi:hypothetical protein OPQ81_011123 [Rhizoctonia solani]|nr:hypothetical protein OPQ81_011123 [Rhizoctonia solani]
MKQHASSLLFCALTIRGLVPEYRWAQIVMPTSPWSFLDPIQQFPPISPHRFYTRTRLLPLPDVTVPVYLVKRGLGSCRCSKVPCCTIAPTYLALQLTIETGYPRRDLSILDDIYYSAWLFYDQAFATVFFNHLRSGRAHSDAQLILLYSLSTHSPFIVHRDRINSPRLIGSSRLGPLTIRDSRNQF